MRASHRRDSGHVIPPREGPMGLLLARLLEQLHLRPGAARGESLRFQCRGWGLVQLLFRGQFRNQELRWRHTNHNTRSVR
jgi:hypothetical protein